MEIPILSASVSLLAVRYASMIRSVLSCTYVQAWALLPAVQVLISAGVPCAAPVPSPGISAPADVVVGEVDGYIDLPVTLGAPGESAVTVDYATADGTGSGPVMLHPPPRM